MRAITRIKRTPRIVELTILMILFSFIGAVTSVAFDNPAQKRVQLSSKYDEYVRARPALTTTTTTTTTTRPAVKVAKVATMPTPVATQPTGDILDALARCESGDPTYNGPSGFDGAFQFLPSTWRTMGTGYDFAWQAPYEVQKEAARRVIERSGWAQFPACARKLGML